ncbi:unnamed protein product (macronuclear) [Paramecium tetraurelia]|uniref:Uncharacterized protein n=1 Tax=Paramecium tetraurelia TaxID=5888 RepID=A0D5W0_PARTE|nr:uncharacterized protein GSPATT00013857001 [Paramecium tetraurelia]CAK78427.1 unnamed protein product [Paramecium tetraurelia]|eukprot:XP_001445824.1 hypothetical protein (macronuclear) [Paramecium tetraurelia strain d4-2]
MKKSQFLTPGLLIQIIKIIDQFQLRYLQNRITLALQLKVEFLGLYVSYIEKYPFLQTYLGANIRNEKQEFNEMLNIIQDRQYQSLDNFNQIESQKNILELLQSNNANLKIKQELAWQYLQFTHDLFNQYKWNMYDELNKHLVYSYLISDIDYVTKNELEYPSFWLKFDTLMLPPALVNQSTYFDQILKADRDQQKKLLSSYNKISNQLVIYLFEIRELLSQFAKSKLQIQIFPSQLNFNCIRQDNQKPYYLNTQHFEKFVEQNSKRYKETRQNISYFENYLEKNNKISLNIFDYYPYDQISSGLILVQEKQREQNTKEFQEYWQNLYKQKYPTKGNIDSLQIKPASFKYLHSLNCTVNSSFEYLQHIIDPESMICRQCKEEVDDYGTLFYDITFYRFYQCLKGVLLSPYYMDIPGVYICPISLRFIGAKNTFEIVSEILNQEGKVLLELYKLKLKFELEESVPAKFEDDDQDYEKMNEIRERNQEQILNYSSDEQQII